MSYVDGFIVAVPKENIEAYKEFSAFAGSIWKEYGALEYVECIGDDVPYGTLTSFPRAVQAKEDEVVVFSWIVYRSRQERDDINAKVMADPRLKGDQWQMPFDGKRMIYGGFETLLRL
ncbi:MULTISPECIES: DUF1428 family protein [unclassified Rhizobium]|uniref:DUF1428 domain-containing protein n=1 Tax=unclassified Rhizobium TaxID=2613769 RepID=UPI001A99C5E6|nr:MULTISPECIES: DUF1428 family protein [unclassified Rhizobium]MBX5165050.1 DUF1428 family protein [Rhizobium sp. NZLR4b]MBX5170184.1 DUF1428 family protein [Rhizobium sp. NZLR1b]MBX5184991.1 DUF1428 family protein [Rhizobium sp. NZLR5]MBX5189845.1 DUF1428 family protein [Rhizobium sp. NZLR3b]MBX5194873.1 DUF1428 family protein [Rhizobium sp. NZLR10]